MNRVSRAAVAYWRFNERAFNSIKSVAPQDPWVIAALIPFMWTAVFALAGYGDAATAAAIVCVAIPVVRAALGR
ncbi:hypothetical protein [Streptomyces sp. URMC 124]|uniref:hypothetical protein n=1 Tax=Streptomyces sp. URMC 124 TaxID=3423405 RepID=UPI003F1A6FB3